MAQWPCFIPVRISPGQTDVSCCLSMGTQVLVKFHTTRSTEQRLVPLQAPGICRRRLAQFRAMDDIDGEHANTKRIARSVAKECVYSSGTNECTLECTLFLVKKSHNPAAIRKITRRWRQKGSIMTHPGANAPALLMRRAFSTTVPAP